MHNTRKFSTLFASIALIVGLSACAKAKDEQVEPTKKVASEKAPAKTETTKNEAAKTMPATDSGKILPGGSFADASGEYTIDSEHTQLVFSVSHLGASHQYGQFTKVAGSFSIDGKDIGKSKIKLEVPTGSVFTAAKKRDDHLRGPDFFDAKQFPKITFTSTEVTATGSNEYTVKGDLTLHGVTKNITIALTHGNSAADPEMMGGAFRTGFNGSFAINRSDFGLNYMPGALGEKIKLLLALEGTRNK
ncbi:MAG: YceI family protein [Kofleriaceae bacterium]|nr:YceI family protein [Kofleriaceae bacterium]